MFQSNKNKGGVLAILGALFVLIIMSFSSTQPKHNFKVLPQDITHDSLMGIMKGFNKALGVKCGFCHAKSEVDSTKLNFASDDLKHKSIARHMMTMAADINVKYFNLKNSARPDTIQVVTCVTCHRGSEHPVNSMAKLGNMETDGHKTPADAMDGNRGH
jgi:hypothetical protein